MSIQPIATRCIWECDWCKKEAETFGVEAHPERWEVVRLHGIPEHEAGRFNGRQEERDALLCPSCAQVYWKHIGEMTRFAFDFWWCRVRLIAEGKDPSQIKFPWTDEDRKKDPKNWD